jgi:hypothetical protein
VVVFLIFQHFIEIHSFSFLPHIQKKITFVLDHTTDQRQRRAAADVKLNYAQLGIAIIQLKSHTIPTHDNYEIICQSKFWNKRKVILAINIESK